MSEVTRDELRELHEKRDLPGIVRFVSQSLWLIASWVAAVFLFETSKIAAGAAIVSAGFALITFFPAMHEAGHKTAFRTSWMNEVVLWIGAILMLQAPTFFREFHWEHHRKTQHREDDPEINAAPDLLDGWPTNPLVYLGLVNGQPFLLGKLMFTVSCALLPSSLWSKQFTFVPEKQFSRVAWESRLVLVILAGSVAAGLHFVPHFAWLLLAWPISHMLLGFYLMAEHTGLPNDGSQTHRTRTIETNALVRWAMWNMPYHAEHHEHPAVPFHAVPKLHTRMLPSLEHTTPGILAFHAEALRHMFTRG